MLLQAPRGAAAAKSRLCTGLLQKRAAVVWPRQPPPRPLLPAAAAGTLLRRRPRQRRLGQGVGGEQAAVVPLEVVGVGSGGAQGRTAQERQGPQQQLKPWLTEAWQALLHPRPLLPRLLLPWLLVATRLQTSCSCVHCKSCQAYAQVRAPNRTLGHLRPWTLAGVPWTLAAFDQCHLGPLDNFCGLGRTVSAPQPSLRSDPPLQLIH